jgi:hypothetical protein
VQEVGGLVVPTDLEIQMEVERLAVRDFAVTQHKERPTITSPSFQMPDDSGGSTTHIPAPPTAGTTQTGQLHSTRSRRKRVK